MYVLSDVSVSVQRVTSCPVHHCTLTCSQISHNAAVSNLSTAGFKEEFTIDCRSESLWDEFVCDRACVCVCVQMSVCVLCFELLSAGSDCVLSLSTKLPVKSLDAPARSTLWLVTMLTSHIRHMEVWEWWCDHNMSQVKYFLFNIWDFFV